MKKFLYLLLFITLFIFSFSDIRIDDDGNFIGPVEILGVLYTSNDSFFGDTNAVFDLSNISTILLPSGDYQFDVIKPTITGTFGYVGTAAYPYQRAWIDTMSTSTISDSIFFMDVTVFDSFATFLDSVSMSKVLYIGDGINGTYFSGGNIESTGYGSFLDSLYAYRMVIDTWLDVGDRLLVPLINTDSINSDNFIVSDAINNLQSGQYNLGIFAYDNDVGTGFDLYIEPANDQPYLLMYTNAWGIGALLSPDTFELSNGTDVISMGNGNISASGIIDADIMTADSSDFNHADITSLTGNSINMNVATLGDVDITNSLQTNVWTGPYNTNTPIRIEYDNSGTGELYSFVMGEIGLGAITDTSFAIDSLANTYSFKNHYVGGIMDASRFQVDSIWHVYGGFQDSNTTISLTAATWAFVTNASNTLWSSAEYGGFSIVNDTVIVTNSGDYTGNLSITFSGGNGDDYKFRIYNVTQLRQEGYYIGASTTGNNNRVNVVIPIYIDATAGDRLVLQVYNATNGDDPIIHSAMWFMQYLHD